MTGGTLLELYPTHDDYNSDGSSLWSGDRVDTFRPSGCAFAHDPRNVVRFTNAARFLYRVIAGSDVPSPQWHARFFDVFTARWQRERDPENVEPGIQQQVDRWFDLGRNRAPRIAVGSGAPPAGSPAGSASPVEASAE